MIAIVTFMLDVMSSNVLQFEETNHLYSWAVRYQQLLCGLKKIKILESLLMFAAYEF